MGANRICGPYKWRMKQPAYDVINEQVGFGFGPSRQYGLRLWGKNLINEHYYVYYADESAPGKLGDAAPPRLYGVALDFKF